MFTKPRVQGFADLERKRQSTWILSFLVIAALGVGFYVTMVSGANAEEVTPLFGTMPVLRGGLLVLLALLAVYIIRGELATGRLMRELWEKKVSIDVLNQRVVELSVLHDLSAAINTMLDMDKTTMMVMDSAFQLTSAEIGILLLSDAEGKTCQVKAGRGLCGGAPQVVDVDQLGRGGVSEALKTGKMSIDSSSARDPILTVLLGGERKLASVVCAPLKRRDRVIGAFCLGNESWSDSFDKHDLALLGIFANQVAIALENTQLFENLQESLVELKETQEKMIQTGKMAAVGQLAAGVAHELNNPIVGILGYSQYALEKIKGKELSQMKQDDVDKYVKYLGYIERESQRCKAIIQNLLSFSRANSVEMAALDIRDIVEETFTFIEHQLTVHNVEVVKELGDEPGMIKGNRTQLQQVFTNLIINAQKAMPEGGRLTVSCGSGKDGEKETVAVRFTDTGCGIAPEHISKIFDPFFTTRKVGEGTGLGLSLSHGIVRNHGGEIAVASEVGKGTTFTITLPKEMVAKETMVVQEPAGAGTQ